MAGLHFDLDFGNLATLLQEFAGQTWQHLPQSRGDRAGIGVDNNFPRLAVGHATGVGQKGRRDFLKDALQFDQPSGVRGDMRQAAGCVQVGIERARCHIEDLRRDDVHIILVSDRLATARSITLTLRHVALAALGFVLLVLSVSTLFSYVTVRHAAEIRLPFLQSLLVNIRAQETQKTQDFLRENLNTMAVRLGQLQAQLMRLDTLGERLGQASGIKLPEARVPDARSAETPGQGGPLVEPGRPLSVPEMQRELDNLSRQLESKGDYLGLIEDGMMDERVKKNLLPTALPVEAPWNASGFGLRADPFTGERAMHEGIDFIAEAGTPIVAAAAGIVVTSERHPQYGNVVEIDHGNDLVTRYAHASKLFVKQGALIKRGQKIAEIGSTGRSTGPHLHFEVRFRGAAQNPARFLQNAQQQKLASVRRK